MPLKPLIPLCLAAFAGFLNLFGMNPFFVDIADDIGATVPLVGYTATAALLMTALAGATIGPLAGRLGTRRTLVTGLILAGISAAGTALAFSFGNLVAARLLAGIGGSITGGVTVGAAALIYPGRQRQRALAIVTASMAMAVVIGIFLMTTLAEPWGWRGAYFILGGFLGLVAALNRFMLDPDESEAARPHGVLRLLTDAYRPILSHRPLRRLLVACALHPAALNGGTAYIGAFLVSQHDVSTRLVGLAFSLVGIAYLVGNVLAGGLSGRQAHVIFSSGVFLMGAFWMTGYLAPVPPLVIAVTFGCATLVAGTSWVTLLTMVADRTPANLGTAMVLSSSLLSLGGAIGIAVSAAMLDVGGYGALALGVGLLALLGAVFGWVGPTEGEAPEICPRTARMPARGP